jgi:hypothetical protein
LRFPCPATAWTPVMTTGIRTGDKIKTNIKTPTKLAMVSLTLSAGRISYSSVISKCPVPVVQNT